MVISLMMARQRVQYFFSTLYLIIRSISFDNESKLCAAFLIRDWTCIQVYIDIYRDLLVQLDSKHKSHSAPRPGWGMDAVAAAFWSSQANLISVIE